MVPQGLMGERADGFWRPFLNLGRRPLTVWYACVAKCQGLRILEPDSFH